MSAGDVRNRRQHHADDERDDDQQAQPQQHHERLESIDQHAMQQREQTVDGVRLHPPYSIERAVDLGEAGDRRQQQGQQAQGAAQQRLPLDARQHATDLVGERFRRAIRDRVDDGLLLVGRQVGDPQHKAQARQQNQQHREEREGRKIGHGRGQRRAVVIEEGLHASHQHGPAELSQPDRADVIGSRRWW